MAEYKHCLQFWIEKYTLIIKNGRRIPLALSAGFCSTRQDNNKYTSYQAVDIYESVEDLS
jgi:hypothetical protein